MTFSIQLHAQQQFKPLKNVEAFKKTLQTESQKTTSIACEFTQERVLTALTQPLISKGNFWFKKPASVRWEYKEPYQTLIILTKRKVYVQEDNKQQEFDMQSGSAFQNLGKIMFSFILGDISAAEQDYHIEYQENNELYFVRLVPKKIEKDALTQIELYFDKKDYSLSRIVMFETADDYTAISFRNKILNGTVSNDLFRFKK